MKVILDRVPDVARSRGNNFIILVLYCSLLKHPDDWAAIQTLVTVAQVVVFKNGSSIQ